jgi:GntR family transcriptional regulator/MocR family aminotransferase
MSPTTPIVLERASDEPLYRQIENQLRSAIRDGRLRPGARLPGVRTMATALGVARITVATAYEQLAAEGFIEGRVGSGTRVVDDPPLPPPTDGRAAGAPIAAAPPAMSRSFAPPRIGSPAVGRSDALVDLGPTGARLDDFPFATWERLLREAVHELASARRGDAGEASGDPVLREALAERLGAARGLRVDPAQVIVTTGDWATLSTIADAWPGPAAPALVEDPGEPWVRSLLAARGRRVVPIATDERGLRPDALPATLGAPSGLPILIHVTPAWGAVLGGTLPLERRRELLARAGRTVRIVEDDRDAELRLEGPPPPALAGQDPLGRVVHLRGLERDLYPGARLGYFVVPPADVPRLSSFLEAQGRGPGVIEQRAFARFVALGLFDRHLRRLRQRLVVRQTALVESLERLAAGRLAAAPALAGRHVVVRILEPDLSASRLAERARSHGVRVTPLADSLVAGGADDALLVGFGGMEPEGLREGVRRLARALDALVGERGRPPASGGARTTRVALRTELGRSATGAGAGRR